jgi:hypothetical protein
MKAVFRTDVFTNPVAVIFVVRREFEMYIFPLTLRAFPEAAIPIPILEATNEAVFMTLATFAKLAKIFVAVIAFDAYKLPWMASCGPPTTGVVPIPTLEVTPRDVKLATPDTFARTEKRPLVVIAFDTYTLPTT